MLSAATIALRKNALQKTSLGVRNFAASSSAGLTTVLVRADVAYARSFLTQTHLKGTMGEFFAERYFLNNQLEQNIRGNWIALNPRTGPQGLDHFFMKTGKNGHLYWMVGESKYGSSQLGTTVDGVRQLSTQWTTDRIQKLGQQYSQLATQNVELKVLPHVPPKAQFDIPVNGKIVSFWKDSNNNWFFSGTSEELGQAQVMAQKMGASLTSANCSIRVRLFHIEAVGDDLKITLYQVKPSEVSTISNMTPSSEFSVKGILGKNIADKDFQKAVASALKNKFPNLSDEELREMADDIVKKYKAGEFLQTPRHLWQTVTLQSLAAAGIAGTIDIAAQLVFSRKIDITHALIASGSAGIGTATGQLISIMLLKTQMGNQVVRSISSFLNLGTSMTRSVFSGLGGGIVTSVLLAYGSYAFGYCDIKQAHRNAIAGAAGSLAATTVGIGVPALVAHFATCGTHVAISSLHGIAATKATLAWLGFGTVANGGLGVAGGAMLLGGYVIVAGIAVSALVSLGFALYDANERRQYAILLADKYEEGHVWNVIADKNPLPLF